MQIHKYVKKDKMRKLKAFFFCSEDEWGENRTSDRATVDETSPSPPPSDWGQTNAKNIDIHMQKLHFGAQSPDYWWGALFIYYW